MVLDALGEHRASEAFGFTETGEFNEKDEHYAGHDYRAYAE